MRVRLVFVSSLAALVLLGHGAGAADHPVGGDLLRLVDPQDVTYRSVRFRARRDAAVAPSTANDPRLVPATLEITGTGPGDGTSGVIPLPVGLWTALGTPPGSKGYRYLDVTVTDGVKKVVFRSGALGGTLAVRGRGAAWPYAITQPQGTIDLRFTVGAEVYCASFTTFAVNEAGRVVARDAPPPADCGGSPSVCGNGTLEGSEECDDGDAMSGDGCSATCQLEDTSALCAGVPTVAGTALDAVRVATGLSMPTHITAPPLDPSRVFIVEQPGRIRLLKNGVLQPTPFLDIDPLVSCCGERGLLSLAFHPDYESNGRFFVNYTDNAGSTTIARYQVSGNPDLADAGSARILLTVTQPFGNHNGGQLAFGPDGYLYCGMGDGGGGGDPLEAGQDDTTVLGKLLRIDVDVETPPYHAVPPSNPNAGAGLPLGLVWAKGLRNPWRFSFDRATGDLYIADVGQSAVEEVDYQPAASTGGENYGWDIFEGSQCYEPLPLFPTCPSPPTGYTMPVLEYGHVFFACSITGGFVYQGCRLPDLRGTYFYADLCADFIRTFQGVSGGMAQNLADRTADLAPGGGVTIDTITSFGEDARGELYIADYTGEIFMVVPGS
jgi:cysteine-rich repeat protein